MKRGRIVSISHEIPEDSPFKTYRDLKRHWKNTYGYRLPECEDDMNFYQIRFGPLGGKLFTYPEVCLRGRELQKVTRIDPKPILRAFMLEIQAKFPTVCGCPIKLQSKAKFTVADLFPSGQDTIKNQPNLTNKMSSSRPSVYRTKDEMEKMLSSTSNISIPNPTSCLLSLKAPKEINASTNEISHAISESPSSLTGPVTPNNKKQVVNKSFRDIPKSIEAGVGLNTSSMGIRPISKEQPDLNKDSISGNDEKSVISMNFQSNYHGNKGFTKTPDNTRSIISNEKEQIPAYTPITKSDVTDKQLNESQKFIPQFKPKKLLPLMESTQKPAVAQKIVPVFHPQKKSSAAVCVSQLKTKSTVNKPFISHTPSRLSIQGHFTLSQGQRLTSNTNITSLNSSSLSNITAQTPLNRPTFCKKMPLFKKSVTPSASCASSNMAKVIKGKEGNIQKEKKTVKRPKAIKRDSQNESKKAKKLKKAET